MIQDRIKNNKEYFLAFNITDEIAYILANLPKKWELVEKGVREQYKCEVSRRNEGVFILTEIENGTDVLFDTLEFIIKYNIELEEKSKLLKIKADELSLLFATEPLEKLQTIQFTFPKNKMVIRKKKQNISTNIKQEETVIEDKKETIEESIDKETNINVDSIKIKNDKKEKDIKKNNQKKAKNTSLMKLAKNVVNKNNKK